MSERYIESTPTKHHLWFERGHWEKRSKFHKELVRNPGYIIPMPANLHNRTRDCLHANVPRIVPMIELASAKHLSIVSADLGPGNWLHNIDFAINTLTELSEHATAEHLELQRGFVLRAILRNHFGENHAQPQMGGG